MIWRILFVIAILTTEAHGYSWSGHHWSLYPTLIVNQNGSPDCTGEFTAIENAMQTWSSVTTSSFTMTYGGTTSMSSIGYDEINLITWIETDWEAYYDAPKIAVTTIIYDGDTGELLDTDMALNGEYYTWSSSGEAGKRDVQNTVTHELGHVTGLNDLYGGGDTEKTLYGYSSSGETKKRTLELDDEDGARYIYFNPTVTGSLSENQTWLVSRLGSTINVTGNVTVPTGKTLDVRSGLSINFGGSYKLRVEGKFLASSSTFTRTGGGQWYGIEFYSANSGSVLSYATMQNAQYGVYVYNSDVSMSHCTMSYNTNGVYAASYSGSITWSLLQNNNYGVRCGTYGDPDISPSNILRYNGRGVYVESDGVPNLGSLSGYNSIYDNDYYEVESQYAGTIYAKGNWWGAYPASPSISGTVDYSNALSSNPNGWAKIAVLPRSTNTSNGQVVHKGVIGDSNGVTGLDEAYRLLQSDNDQSAFVLFKDLATRYPDGFVGSRALASAVRLADKLGFDSKKLLREVSAKNDGRRLAGTARLLLVGYLAKEGTSAEARDILASLVDFPNAEITKHALYNAGNIAWSYLDDKPSGEDYFRRLIARFPDDPLAESAMATLGEEPPVRNGADKSTDATSGGFGFDNCYPNPFNPSTQLSYDLSEPALISLTIYDVLGREVSVLASGLRPPGRHVETWNGTNEFGQSVGSGFYYARLIVAGDAGQTRFTKTNKLIFVK